MLLLCVSSTDSCRSLLSQPRWIAVLLGLLRLGPPYAQRRALRLLRRLLPHCDPESLADTNHGALAPDGTDWSIVSIVKESVAGAASLPAAIAGGSEDGVGTEDSCEDIGVSCQSEVASETGGGGGGGGSSGSAPPIVRVTSLSNSVHANLIPARSLICFFLDAIGGSYQATPRPEWLGDAEADGSASPYAGSSNDDRGGVGGTLRELRAWYRGQAPSPSSGREQHGQRNAWTFSQLEGLLVCESVSLLRTLLQTSAWGGVTATLLQDAFQRGNSCLRLLAREAADKAEAAAGVATAAAAVNTTPASTTGEVGKTSGAGAQAEGVTAVVTAVGTAAGQAPADSQATPGAAAGALVGTSSAAIVSPSLPTSTGEASASKAPLASVSTVPSTTGTLLRTIGALSVLGGHVDVLYPGASAEIMPIDQGVPSHGGGGRGGRGGRGSQASSSGWGVRMGRSVFGLSGLERTGLAGGGDGRGRGGSGGGFPSSGASSAAANSALGGRPCVVVSLSPTDGQAEVILGDYGGGVEESGGGGDARKPRVVPLDCLQAVPNVPVRPGTLPAGLAQRILETLTLWCLDKSLGAAFSEQLSPAVVPFVPPPVGSSAPPNGSEVGGGGDDAGGNGLAGVLSTAVLDRHLLLGLIRCQAAKAAQTLLLHPRTASDFVKLASAPALGRKAKGGAGAVLLEVASGVSSSSGLGDIGAMEELVAMLLAHWQFSLLDGGSKKVQEARYEYGIGP